MGLRIAAIIALTTLFSYLHILSSMRTQALEQLERHVLERSQREEAIFVLAEDNHAVLKKALTERYQAWRQQEPGPAFDRLFVRRADGTLRNQPQGFDGTRMPGVFVPTGVTVDDDLRRWLLAAYDVVAQYGPAFHVRFMSTGVMLPNGSIVGYWPEGPTYFPDLDPQFSIQELEYFTDALPANNPRRETAWTATYEDAPSKTWMVTVTTPLDLDGRHVATFNHDVLLNDLMSRTVESRLPGAYNFIFQDDGQLIAHPKMMEQLGPDPHLRTVIERVMARPSGQTVLELSESGEYAAVSRLKGPGWNFITVLPNQVVSSPAFNAARYVLVFGLLSLLIELAIMYWVLRQHITQPLLAFTQATDQVTAGDFQVTLDSQRDDELGRMAGAFQLMAREVQRREEALRQANEGLEQRVEERTRELKAVHRQLVESARQAGMAEIATNILHNVGNVLTSVHTSALLARERLDGLKLEQVGRVAALLQEHQADLGGFLTQSERGRNVLPFMSQLGENLVEKRKELLSLLEDVGRYTDHIGTIVKTQQDYARLPRLHEPVRLEALVEDALRINAAALGRHQVKVEKRLAELPPVVTDKHKVLMILVNLISNAKYAMDGLPPEQRHMSVRLEVPSAGRLRIVVHDNGVGIAPELLTRIFQYGFTTRDEGHGFGLHSSALAAQELGGSLTAQSEGVGRGATFILELPAQPFEKVA